MAIEIRWKNERTPTWDSMTATSALTDGAVGDTSTGVIDSKSQSGTSSQCSLVSPHAIVTAMKWMGGYKNTITGFSAKLALTLTDNVTTICYQPIGDPVVAPSDFASIAFEVWNATTGVWVALYSQSLTTPLHLDNSGDQIVSYSLDKQSLAPTDSCWARLRLEYQAYSVEGTGGITASVSLTDWRVTASATASLCSDSSGGTVPSGDTIPATDTIPPGVNTLSLTKDCVLGTTVAAAYCFMGGVVAGLGEIYSIPGISGSVVVWDWSTTTGMDFSYTTGVADFSSTTLT